jgi:hypothetical protein
MSNNSDKSLESWIWDAACSIRGAKDAPKYKEYILPLIFAKRLCPSTTDGLKATEMLVKMCGWNEPERASVQSVEVKVNAALVEQLRAG